jgi:fatty acid amide hydrolase
VNLDGLRVGTYADDGVLPASRAIVRAIDRAAGAMRARGCELRAFELPAMRPLLSAYLGALSADGGAAIVAALAGGEIDPVLEPLRRMAGVPARARRLAARAARAFGQEKLALMLDAMGEKTAGELWQLTDALRTYRNALLESMEHHGVDVLLCPAYATAALPQGASKNFTLASSYSIVFNATQLPAGVVPVTRVREDETERPAARDLLERQAAKVDAASAGLPVGVQVVGRPWRDHLVLAAMRAIQAEVSRDEGYPVTPVDPRA